MAELPVGDLGLRNLPVPVSQASPPVDRVLPPLQKSQDTLDPIIHSLEWINDSIDSVVSAVDDWETIKIKDLRELFQEFFPSKKDFEDVIVNALSRQTSYVRDKSFLVQQQVKATEVGQRTIKKPTDNASSSSSSRLRSKAKEPRRKRSALKGYQTALNTAHTLATNPMALVDKVAELPFKLIDKVRGANKNKDKDFDFDAVSSGKSKSGGNFFGSGAESSPSNFFGDFTSRFMPAMDGFTKGGKFKDKGGLFDNIFGGFGGVTSTEESLEDKSMKSAIKADNILFDTFDKPEKSKFGGFLDDQITGGGSGSIKSKDKGLLEALIGPMIIAGLLLLAPYLPQIVSFFKEHFFPFIKTAIDALAPLLPSILQLARAIGGATIGIITKLVDFVGETLVPFFTKSLLPFVENRIVPFVFGVIEKVIGFLQKPEVQEGLNSLFTIFEGIFNFAWGLLEGALTHLFKFLTWIVGTRDTTTKHTFTSDSGYEITYKGGGDSDVQKREASEVLDKILEGTNYGRSQSSKVYYDEGLDYMTFSPLYSNYEIFTHGSKITQVKKKEGDDWVTISPKDLPGGFAGATHYISDSGVEHFAKKGEGNKFEILQDAFIDNTGKIQELNPGVPYLRLGNSSGKIVQFNEKDNIHAFQDPIESGLSMNYSNPMNEYSGRALFGGSNNGMFQTSEQGNKIINNTTYNDLSGMSYGSEFSFNPAGV